VKLLTCLAVLSTDGIVLFQQQTSILFQILYRLAAEEVPVDDYMIPLGKADTVRKGMLKKKTISFFVSFLFLVQCFVSVYVLLSVYQ